MAELRIEPITELDIEPITDNEQWAIPPVSEKDSSGFRVDNLPQKEVTQGPDVSGLKFLGKTAEVGVDIAAAIPEVIAGGITAPIAKAAEGVGHLLNLSDPTIAQIQHTVAYEPVSTLGSKLTELLSIPMEAWDSWAAESAQTNRVALQQKLENAGVDKDAAIQIAATTGATEEAITRGAPYILGLLGLRSQAKDIAEKITSKEKPLEIEPIVEERLPEHPTVAPVAASTRPSELVIAEDGSFTYPIRDENAVQIGEQVGVVKDGVLTIKASAIPDDLAFMRGQGHGTNSLEALVREAHANGLRVESDSNLTQARYRNYEKLSERGLKVEFNPARIEDVTMEGTKSIHRHYTEDSSPVAKVYPRIEPVAEAVSKDWEQALTEDAKRNVEKALDKTIPATKGIEVVDYRPLSDVEKALTRTTDKETTKYTDEGPVTQTVREHRPTEPDLPNRYSTENRVLTLGAGKWIPPSFVGVIKNNSIVKWTTSLIRREEMAVDQARESILYGSEPVKRYGRYTMESTDRGLLTKGREFDEAQKKVYLDILDEYNKPGRETEVSREVLELRTAQAGLDTVRANKVIDLYYAVRAGLDSIVNKVEKTSDQLMAAGSDRGFKFDKHPGYFPAIWKGDFQTTAYNPKTGKVLEKRTSYTNLPTDKFGAKALEKELKEKYPDAEVSTRKREFNNLDPAYEALTDILIKAEKIGDESLAEAVRKQRGIAGARAHALSREGVRGFEWDPKVHSLDRAWKGYEETLSNFVGAMLRAESGLRIQFNMDNLNRSTLGRVYPNSVSWSTALVDDYLGRKPWLDERLSEITSDFIGQQGARKAVGFTSRWMTRTQILLGNLTHIAIQPTQYRHTLAKMAGMSPEFGISGAETALIPFEAMRDILTRNPEMERALKEAAKNGTIEPTMARFLYEEETALNPKSKESMVKKIGNFDKSAYSYFDELTRTLSFASFYNFLRKAGRSEYDAVMEASKLTDDYNVKYSPSETPSAQRGISGSVIGKYQRWSATESAALLEALTIAKNKGDIRQLGVLVAGTATIAGITGLWGMKDADKLIEFTNSQGITNYQLPSMWVMQNAPEWVAVGPVQSYLNMDTSVTASPQMVRNISDLPMLSWAAEVVASNVSLGAKLATSKASKLDLERAIMSTTPSGMKEWVRESFERDNITLNPSSWFMKEGETYLQHSLKTGRGTFEVTKEDQLKRIYGGRSLQDAKVQLAARWMFSMEQGASHDIEAMTDYISKQIIMHGDKANFSALISETARQWNLTPSEINTKIKSKVEKGYKTLEIQLKESKQMQRHTSGKVMDFIESKDARDKAPKELEIEP